MPALERHVLEDGDISVAILNLGCITQDWRVPLGDRRVPVVLGHSAPEAYLHNPAFLGVIAGRVANRISGAAFELGGERFDLPANEPPHHLHGGPGGLHVAIWEMQADGARAVRLRHVSPDGDQGYPGRVVFAVTITLRGATLVYDMQAHPDRPTPINLAQHSYYNLMGAGAIWDHRLEIAADRYTPTGPGMIPTGQIVPLDGRPYDLREPGKLAEADPRRTGLDMNFVLQGGAGPQARLSAPNGLILTIATDQPCLQLYTGAHLAGSGHAPFAGLCLEPQAYPNALNTSGFPFALATPERPYRQRLAVRIASGGGAC